MRVWWDAEDEFRSPLHPAALILSVCVWGIIGLVVWAVLA